ncbi:hypothetical protein Q3G72_028997 [Acer saccharum]|nr:hypothetical protein Q3G72_028997 [Acer saccharum]
MASINLLIIIIITFLQILIIIFFFNTAYCNSIKYFPSTILIFGDSTVDTGNNNYIETLIKGNYLPYGQDFPGHIPTGRFSNGKLVPDFIAFALGIKAEAVAPFLDPNLSDDQLLSGVNFESSGSGFDDLTTLASKAIPVSNQIKLFRDYIRRIMGIVGEGKAKKIISGSLVVISADAQSYNLKLSNLIGQLKPSLPCSRITFADIYQPLIDMINHPHEYGPKDEKLINREKKSTQFTSRTRPSTSAGSRQATEDEHRKMTDRRRAIDEKLSGMQKCVSVKTEVCGLAAMY